MSNTMKKVRKVEIWMWVVVALQALMTAIVMRCLPLRIPMHFNAQGEVTRIGYKYELYIMLALSAVTALVSRGNMVSLKDKVDKAEDERSKATAETNCFVFSLVYLCIILFMVGIEIALMVISFSAVDVSGEFQGIGIFTMMMNIMMSLMFIALGNVMPKVRRNATFGVKTSWSMYNDETWARSNRIGGKLFVAMGFVSLIVALVVESVYAMAIVFGLVIVVAIASIVVSYCIYSEVKENEEYSKRD